MEKKDLAPKPKGTYENPVALPADQKTTIEEVRQIVKDINQDVDIETQKILESTLERQRLVEVNYLSKDADGNDQVLTGQIIIDKDLVDDIVALFLEIRKINEEAEKNSTAKYYISSVIPIQNEKYIGIDGKPDDEISMEQNNTSGFNFRTIINTEGIDTGKISLHGLGLAFDIEPRVNPVRVNGVVKQPKNGVEINKPTSNTLTADNVLVKFLIKLGFEWGGNWESMQDNHHFQKVSPIKVYIDYYIYIVKKFTKTKERITKEDIIHRVNGLIKNSSTLEHCENLSRLLQDDEIAEQIGFAFLGDFKRNLYKKRISLEKVDKEK